MLYIAAVVLYAGAAFTMEARRTSGVTAHRLLHAGVGSALFAAAFAVAGLATWFVGISRLAAHLNHILVAGTFACYFLAFSTPRRLRSGWQRAEQAKYLSGVADRSAEERGARAAEDLYRATRSSVGNSAVVVALRERPPDPRLVVRAASDPTLIDLPVDPADGPIGRADRSGQAIAAQPAECEGELGRHLTPLGMRLLVAPVVTATHTWGVVLVVQRRGSLFPEDDERLLAQLARYAGTALDHALLIVERRERENRAAERRLREVELRMSLMLDSIKDYALFVVDDEGKVAAWHVGAELVFGYTAEEMADEPAALLYGLTPGDYRMLLAEARRHGQVEREAPCRRRDGSRFVGATTIRPLIGDEGDPPGFVVVTRDVTERRDFEDRLRQSQKMEAIGRLAGGIAHDFNNLLMAIQGHADLAAAPLKPGDPRLEEIAAIHKHTDRAASLTRQLLSFSRRQMVESTPINLSQLVVDLLPMLRRLIGEQIEIVDQTASKISPTTGDRSQVEQIIVNLAVNARDAMPGGGLLTIRTSNVWIDDASVGGGLAPGAYVLLEVTDTGIGMDRETQQRIFEPFYTTKEFGSGTGLGLATVYGIITQMSGAVLVESEPDKGSTFRLYFPEARVIETASAAPAVPAVPVGGNETILVVEDDEGVRTFLVKTLTRSGYRVLVAETAADALAQMQAHAGAVDLIIADVVLPGGSGPELVRELTRLRPGLRALYISGYADTVLTRERFVAKASHFLQKPFTTDDLLLRIRQILPTT
jgi:PAS domain S-box-containing protein